MTFDLTEVARAMGSAATPPPAAVSGWSVDSRTCEPGDLFFALRGPHHDGHEFLAQAFEKKAVGAVVDRPVQNRDGLLPVEDTGVALLTLAGWARRQWRGTVVAVTGSAGKTTTKDAIAHLLSSEMAVGRTAGNFNNHVGLPLSILRLPAGCRLGVLEMGMNHAGEIRALARLARPEIGVVTNVGYAHMQAFASIDEIALAKRELVEELAADGTAVLNADDPRVARFREVHHGAAVTFGLSEQADVRARDVELTGRGSRFRVDRNPFECPLAGRHGVMSVLAGLAVARVLGIAPERLREAARSLRPGAMRGERITRDGITIWNDCYNSNPEALRTMLETLGDTPARRRIAVLGEMLELGRWTEPLHREAGKRLVECGISVLLGIRGAARLIADAAVEAGLPADAAYFFDTPEAAGDCLRKLAREGDAILFKGSRDVRVERALERFLE